MCVIIRVGDMWVVRSACTLFTVIVNPLNLEDKRH